MAGMREVANKPKISAKNKAHLKNEAEPGPLALVYDGWLDDQKFQVENPDIWSGGLSPSAKLSWSECVEDFYDRYLKESKGKLYKSPLDFTPQTLSAVNMGIIFHRAFEYEFDKYCPNFPANPNFPTKSLRNWYLEVRPELPVHDKESGVRGLIDRWPEYKGRPAIYDLKTKFTTPKSWADTRNVMDIDSSHFIQLLLYFYCVVKGKYFDVEPRHVGVGYWNVPTVPCLAPPSRREIFKTVTKDLWEKTCNWVDAYALGRKAVLSDRKVKCTNPYCSTHGGRR